MDKIEILGVNIAVTNLDDASKIIESWIRNKTKTYVCIAPVSTIIDCQKDKEYRDIVNGSGMTTPDGMPLVWLGKLRGGKTIDRTYGPDLVNALCSFGQDKGFKHYFYGGTDEIIRVLLEKLKLKYPKLEVAGSHSPGFIEKGQKEDIKVIEKINHSKADILWVGLGSPKQDYWMKIHRQDLDVPVIVGVGAAFDFISGAKKQAPRWMQRSGMEWVFRFASEPKRLWRRYLIGNTQFVYFIVKDSLNRKFKGGS